MSKKAQIISGSLTLIIAILGVFLYVQKAQKISGEIAQQEEIIAQSTVVSEKIRKNHSGNNPEGKKIEIGEDILYNANGTIDTSNWHECIIGGGDLKFLCPMNWGVSGAVLTNDINLHNSPMSKSGYIYISVGGGPIDVSTDVSLNEILKNNIDEFTKGFDKCMEHSTKKGEYLLECEKFSDEYGNYIKQYLKVFQDLQFDKKMLYVKQYLTINAFDRDTYERQKSIVDRIINSFTYKGQAFIPSP